MAVAPTPIDLYTPDGHRLAGSLFLPAGAGPFPAVLLSHMGGADKESWRDIPERLQSTGYAVLTYDFRGHGQSDGHLDPPNAAIDVQTALAYLRAQPAVEGQRIALVGASMGGSASVIVAAGDPGISTVVALSTSPESAGQYPIQVIDSLAPRPFLAIGCDNDALTKPERVRQLYDAAVPPKRLVMLECDAHGNDILGTDAAPDLADLLLLWIRDQIKPVP